MGCDHVSCALRGDSPDFQKSGPFASLRSVQGATAHLHRFAAIPASLLKSGPLFAPQRAISQATIVTVLARLAKADLSQFEDASEDNITPGQQYTTAAIWAKRSGLLPEGGTFTGSETTTRDQMAVMLVKYLRSMGKDTTPPSQRVEFADADGMSQEGNDAFQVLYGTGVFKGVGDLRMNPTGSTTRAHFAALIHRIANLE